MSQLSDPQINLRSHVETLCRTERNTSVCPEGLSRAADWIAGWAVRQIREPRGKGTEHAALEGGVVHEYRPRLLARRNQGLSQRPGWIGAVEAEELVVVRPHVLAHDVDAELDRDLLVWPGSSPDRHCKPGGLEVQKMRREPGILQGCGRGQLVVEHGVIECMLPDQSLLRVQQVTSKACRGGRACPFHPS